MNCLKNAYLSKKNKTTGVNKMVREYIVRLRRFPECDLVVELDIESECWELSKKYTEILRKGALRVDELRNKVLKCFDRVKRIEDELIELSRQGKVKLVVED